MLTSVNNSAVRTQDANFLLSEKEQDTCIPELVKLIPDPMSVTTMELVTETLDGHAIKKMNEL